MQGLSVPTSGSTSIHFADIITKAVQQYSTPMMDMSARTSETGRNISLVFLCEVALGRVLVFNK